MRPRVRTATLTGYVELARAVGLDPTGMAAAVGLDGADLEVSDRWIPAAPVARLLELSAQRSGVEDFALRMADLRQLGTLGPLSVVVRDEPDLRSALQLLLRYVQIYNEALQLSASRDDVLITVSAWLEFGEPVPTRQSLDLAIAALVGVIRALVGGEWEPLSVGFAHPPPADPAPFHRVFGPWVMFDRDPTTVVFHTRDLARPVARADPSIRPYTEAYLASVVGTAGRTTSAQAADALEELLPLGGASADQVGRRLGMHPRQLQRALAEEDQTFSAVVHAVRARLAERYLSSDGASLTELSQRLGFAAPSAFSRWFRQQFGTSPSEWRAAARAAADHPPGVTPVRPGGGTVGER